MSTQLTHIAIVGNDVKSIIKKGVNNFQKIKCQLSKSKQEKTKWNRQLKTRKSAYLQLRRPRKFPSAENEEFVDPRWKREIPRKIIIIILMCGASNEDLHLQPWKATLADVQTEDHSRRKYLFLSSIKWNFLYVCISVCMYPNISRNTARTALKQRPKIR